MLTLTLTLTLSTRAIRALGAQDEDLNKGSDQNKNQQSVISQAITLVDRMSGIHMSKDVLEDIKLIKSSGMKDALGHWALHPNISFLWSAQQVDDLFQLGEVIESSKADFVDRNSERNCYGDWRN